MRIGSPGPTSPGRPLYVVPQISALPSTSRVVIVHRWLRRSCTGPPLNRLQPDLRALEVGEDAHPVAARVRRLPHQPVDVGVVGVAAVAHVEPGDVHPGVDELTDPAFRNWSPAPACTRSWLSARISLVGPGTIQRRSEGRAGLGVQVSKPHRGESRRRVETGEVNTDCRWCPVRRRAGRSVGGIGAGSVVEPVRYLSTAAAAARPSAIAHTMSDWPRPASPATKTPGTEDMYAPSRATLLAVVELDAQLLDQAGLSRDPGSPSRTAPARPGSRARCPRSRPAGPPSNLTSTSRSARTLPSSSPRNCLVETA